MSALATGLVLAAVGLAGWDGYRAGRRRATRLGANLGAGILASSGAWLLLGGFGTGPIGWCLVAALALGIWWLRLRIVGLAIPEGRQHLGWRLGGLGATVLAALILCQLVAVVLVVAPPREVRTPVAAPDAGPVSASTPERGEETDPWAGVRALGVEVGAVSASLLGEVPVVGRRSAEIAALLRILNATPEEQARMAAHHRLRELADSPAVIAALEDARLQADIEALAAGDLAALERITESPRIAAVQADPAVRRVVAQLDLRDLSAVLDQDATAPAEASTPPR